jgi:hypothetical protein
MSAASASRPTTSPSSIPPNFVFVARRTRAALGCPRSRRCERSSSRAGRRRCRRPGRGPDGRRRRVLAEHPQRGDLHLLQRVDLVVALAELADGLFGRLELIAVCREGLRTGVLRTRLVTRGRESDALLARLRELVLDALELLLQRSLGDLACRVARQSDALVDGGVERVDQPRELERERVGLRGAADVGGGRPRDRRGHQHERAQDEQVHEGSSSLGGGLVGCAPAERWARVRRPHREGEDQRPAGAGRKGSAEEDVRDALRGRCVGRFGFGLVVDLSLGLRLGLVFGGRGGLAVRALLLAVGDEPAA